METYVNNQLCVDGASVDTDASEAREQLHWDPAILVHLTTQEEILDQILVAEVVLSDVAHNTHR